MKKYNVIIVFNKEKDKILMCKREKEPYKNLYNLVGGKVEDGEEELESAYRELKEETGISKEDISLDYEMNFKYFKIGTDLEIFSGVLNKEVKLVEEVNKLYWIDVMEDFTNQKRFAGKGNIANMINMILDK